MHRSHPADAPTQFAPATRAPHEELVRQHSTVASAAVRHAFDVMPLPVAVLNAHRQIVYSNEAFIKTCGPQLPHGLPGLRPGEALRCRNADKAPGGCGTSEACRTCGIVRAILSARQGNPASEDCRIATTRPGGDLDVRVWTRLFHVGPDVFTLLTLMDISHEKHEQALERVFFHDLLNSAAQVRGISTLLSDAPETEQTGLLKLLERTSAQLIEQIEAQRDFAASERGELLVKPSTIRSRALLDATVEAFINDPVVAGRRLRIAPECHDVAFSTDRVLIGRVLTNLTKNALEACAEGDTVTLSSAADTARVTFRVHNPSVMPRDVQLQMFQRFFSTKGAGRGLGAYSVKLLTERYLAGSVSFQSSDPAGTTFVIELPLVLMRSRSH